MAAKDFKKINEIVLKSLSEITKVSTSCWISSRLFCLRHDEKEMEKSW